MTDEAVASVSALPAVPTPEQFLPPDTDPVDPAQQSNLPVRPAEWRDQNIRGGVVSMRRWSQINPMIGVVMSALRTGEQAGRWKWSLRDAIGLDWLSREGRRSPGEPQTEKQLCEYLAVQPGWIARLTRRDYFEEALQAVRLVNLRLLGPRRDAVMVACALGDRTQRVLTRTGDLVDVTIPPDVKWARLWAELDGSLERPGDGAERRVAASVADEIKRHMDQVLPQIKRTVEMHGAIEASFEVVEEGGK